MNQRVIKHIVIFLSFICFMSLWYVDRTTKELANVTNTRLELVSQIANMKSNINQMIAELTVLTDRENRNDMALISAHKALIEQTRSEFSLIQTLIPRYELEILKYRKTFEKINIIWLDTNHDWLLMGNTLNAGNNEGLASLYLELNENLKSLTLRAVNDILREISDIKRAVSTLEKVMIFIQLFAIAIMLGIFTFPFQSQHPKQL